MPIEWTYIKQKLVAMSTSEEDYIATSTTVQSTQLTRRILTFLKLLPPEPTPVLLENQAAITVALKPGPTKQKQKQRKFIDLKQHHLRHYVQERNINIEYVPPRQMLANMWTKGLNKPQFIAIRDALNITPPTAQETNNSTQNHILKPPHASKVRFMEQTTAIPPTPWREVSKHRGVLSRTTA